MPADRECFSEAGDESSRRDGNPIERKIAKLKKKLRFRKFPEVEPSGGFVHRIVLFHGACFAEQRNSRKGLRVAGAIIRFRYEDGAPGVLEKILRMVCQSAHVDEQRAEIICRSIRDQGNVREPLAKGAEGGDSMSSD